MVPKKQAVVDILISNKIDFQLKVIKKDKQGHVILVKGKKSIKIFYATKARAPTFIKQNKTKKQTNKKKNKKKTLY